MTSAAAVRMFFKPQISPQVEACIVAKEPVVRRSGLVGWIACKLQGGELMEGVLVETRGWFLRWFHYVGCTQAALLGHVEVIRSTERAVAPFAADGRRILCNTIL